MVANSDKEKPGRNIFIVGHSSGAIYVWRRQRFSSNTDESNGDKDRGPQAVLPSPAHDQLRDSRYMHKGPVTALKMQPKTQFLYSGSADRTIKLWDIFDSEHPPCLRQTFSGHGGSVTCIEFAPLMGQYPGYMMTGSTDQTVILWKNADGREMMLYPFYIKMRVIELKEWPTSLLFLSTRMAHGDLHIGDSAGKIWRMAFEMQDSKAGGGLRQTEPKVWTGMSSHQLGILQMVAEPHEGVILSISNDITVKVWESLSGASKKMLKNDNRVRFNAMHVDAANCDVYLVDSLGFLTVWNWVSERTMLVQRLTHVENGLLAVSFSAPVCLALSQSLPKIVPMLAEKLSLGLHRRMSACKHACIQIAPIQTRYALIGTWDLTRPCCCAGLLQHPSHRAICFAREQDRIVHDCAWYGPRGIARAHGACTGPRADAAGQRRHLWAGHALLMRARQHSKGLGPDES